MAKAISTSSFVTLPAACAAFAASGGGKIARRGKTWDFDDIRLGLGRTLIEADGHIAREIDMRFAVDAEDLSWLTQDSAGRFAAKGHSAGNAGRPGHRSPP